MSDAIQDHIEILLGHVRRAHDETRRARGPAAFFAVLGLATNLRKVHSLHSALLSVVEGSVGGKRTDSAFLDCAFTLNELSVVYAWATFESAAKLAWHEVKLQHASFPAGNVAKLGSFNNPKSISSLYSNTFGRDPLDRGPAFAKALDELHAHRNVIAHNSGAIDDMFIERTGGHVRDIGYAVRVNYVDVQAAVATAVDATMAVVEVVNAWELNADPASVTVHTPSMPEGES